MLLDEKMQHRGSFALGALLTAVLWVASAADSITLYVAPNGNDTSTGNSPDEALASCAGAMSKVKLLNPWPAGGVVVEFAQGRYPLTPATACGSISVAATEDAPLILRGATEGDVTMFDGTSSLDASRLEPVRQESSTATCSGCLLCR